MPESVDRGRQRGTVRAMQKAPLLPAEIEHIERLLRAAETGTYYELLAADRSITRDEVERSYREYVREWHPDRFFSRDVGARGPAIEDNFVSVTRAYKTLRDEPKRMEYDRGLDQSGVVVPTRAAAPVDSEFEVRLDRGAGGAARVESMQPSSVSRAVEKPKSRAPAMVEKVKQQLAEQLERARRYYDAGKEEFDAGRFTKAESALYLATRYDPKNAEYARIYQISVTKARQLRASSYVLVAEQAEQYQNIKDAITNYRKACECDPDSGKPFFRLANLLRTVEEDTREALALYRKAVQKEPRVVEYRLGLGEMYAQLNMASNALREAQAALELDPRSEPAKTLFRKAKK